jgi:hypothetical protein
MCAIKVGKVAKFEAILENNVLGLMPSDWPMEFSTING